MANGFCIWWQKSGVPTYPYIPPGSPEGSVAGSAGHLAGRTAALTLPVPTLPELTQAQAAAL